ncbi:MAG: Fic family protein [Nitrospirota bacterium]
MYLPKQLKNRLKEKFQKLNKLRPLPKTAVKKLKEQFELEMTYNSNAIEGNSLTLKETFWVIQEGITIKGKPLKDHLEATNHQEALEYLYELVEHEKKATVSEHLIKNIHQLITRNIEKEWAGKYRNSEVRISGAIHNPPSALEIPNLMQKLIQWFANNNKKLHPVELATIIQHKLVHIHPFFDGNGRTSRLLMNLILLKAGYPLVVILKNDRKKYYNVLKEADEGNFKPFVQFVAQAVDRSLTIYLETLTPSIKKEKKKYIPLTEAAKICRYSAKYLNLLASKGKLEAHKVGRNWVTTKKAIKEYIEQRTRKRK